MTALYMSPSRVVRPPTLAAPRERSVACSFWHGGAAISISLSSPFVRRRTRIFSTDPGGRGERRLCLACLLGKTITSTAQPSPWRRIHRGTNISRGSDTDCPTVRRRYEANRKTALGYPRQKIRDSPVQGRATEDRTRYLPDEVRLGNPASGARIFCCRRRGKGGGGGRGGEMGRLI